jgi:hypothetical protein
MSDSKGRDAATAIAVNGARWSWRDAIKVHPAADLFPLMSESELRELGEDIKANGLRASIVLYKDKLLDGRNRLDAMELVGIKFGFMAEQTRPTKNKFFYLHACDGSGILDGDAAIIDHFDGDPYNFVLSANLHRRHLTSEQKRELIAAVLKARPGESNRKIAKQTKASHVTVGAVRNELESTGQIDQLEKTTGADGKQRKAKKKPSARNLQFARDVADGVAGDACLMRMRAEELASGSAEVSTEQRKAENAALADDHLDALMGALSGASNLTAIFRGILNDYPQSEKTIAALIKPVEQMAGAWFRIKADVETKLHDLKMKGPAQ